MKSPEGTSSSSLSNSFVLTDGLSEFNERSVQLSTLPDTKRIVFSIHVFLKIRIVEQMKEKGANVPIVILTLCGISQLFTKLNLRGLNAFSAILKISTVNNNTFCFATIDKVFIK
jgi:hypothetical protein